jgi:hypothetical protein
VSLALLLNRLKDFLETPLLPLLAVLLLVLLSVERLLTQLLKLKQLVASLLRKGAEKHLLEESDLAQVSELESTLERLESEKTKARDE